MTRIRVDVSDALLEVEATPRNVERATKQWLRQAGLHAKLRMQQVITRKVQHRHGRRPQRSARSITLAGSVRSEVRGDHVEVGPTVDYAAHANYPTRPHEIRARNGRALTIPSVPGGIVRTLRGRPRTVVEQGLTPKGRTRLITRDVILVAKVQHPGTPGLHYLEDTEVDLKSSGDLERLYRAELERELRGRGGA